MFNYIIKFICNFIYFFLKINKCRTNKITFISRLSNEKTLDFILIENQLKEIDTNINCVFICKKINDFKSDFFDNIKYTIKSLYHLSNSKICITDSYSLPISIVKHKKCLRIIQIWHSMGAIKKFGYQTLNKESGRKANTAKILKMHKNYDYIISGSKEMTKYFSKAFNYPKNKFLNYGLPRIDYLINNEIKLKKEIFNEYKVLKNKINILYAPTFRTNLNEKCEELINSIDYSKYNLIVKSHANQKLKYKNKKVLECKKYTALQMICACDYVITDYSGIMIEAASINKKLLLFLYDYDEYCDINGLNIDLYKEFPKYVFKSAKDIKKYLVNNIYDMNVVLNFKKKYIDVFDGSSTKKICQLVMKLMEEK